VPVLTGIEVAVPVPIAVELNVTVINMPVVTESGFTVPVVTGSEVVTGPAGRGRRAAGSAAGLSGPPAPDRHRARPAPARAGSALAAAASALPATRGHRIGGRGWQVTPRPAQARGAVPVPARRAAGNDLFRRIGAPRPPAAPDRRSRQAPAGPSGPLSADPAL
jgi:hypothetical protein